MSYRAGDEERTAPAQLRTRMEPFSTLIAAIQVYHRLSPVVRDIIDIIASGGHVTAEQETLARQETDRIMREARTLLPPGHPDRPA